MVLEISSKPDAESAALKSALRESAKAEKAEKSYTAVHWLESEGI